MHPAAKLADIADAMIFEPLLCIPTASRSAFKIDRFHVDFYFFFFIYKISICISYVIFYIIVISSF